MSRLHMSLPAPFTHIQAVVFDFDGTLARLTLDFKAMNEAVRQAVLRVFPQAPPFTPPALEWVRACMQATNKQPDLSRLISARAEETLLAVEVAAAQKGALFPHTRPLLKTLSAQGVAAGVITRNCRAAVLTVFPDLEAFCPLLAREDVPATKPDPTHLLRMLDILHVAPQDSLMVGDHPMDILTGKRAGAMTAGVTCGHCPQAQLLAAEPDIILDHCGQLVAQCAP